MNFVLMYLKDGIEIQVFYNKIKFPQVATSLSRLSATLYYPFPVTEMALLSITNFCNSKMSGLIKMV